MTAGNDPTTTNQAGPNEGEQEVCDYCDPQNPAQWRCDYCRNLFCDNCWTKLASHRNKDPRHVKTLPSQQQLVSNVLDADLDPQTLSELHARDAIALWFGVVQSDRGDLDFEGFPRFQHLVNEHNRVHNSSGPCYPKLVSFVGTTGAGKSTLIRLILERAWLACRNGLDTENISVPVGGNRLSSQPTSGDVHLYRDALTDLSEVHYPIFFADCEGFTGGDVAPSGSKVQQYLHTVMSTLDSVSPAYVKRGYDWIQSPFKRGVRIKTPDGGFIRRQEVIEKLFPRLLYNFSDVIIQVMSVQTLKTMEHCFLQILKWAKASESAATNHPFLPHLIVVINSAPDDSVWHAEAARSKILEEQARILEENPTVRLYAKQYRDIGTTISNLADLIHCFYAEVEFLFIPSADSGRNGRLFLTQIKKLHEMIEQAANDSKSRKAASQTLLPSEDQAELFKLAFEHYLKDMDKPFDFLETLFSIRPLPNNLTNNFFRLLRAVRSCATPGESVKHYLAQVAPILAASIALDAARSYQINARLTDVFKGSTMCSAGNSSTRSSSSANTYQNQLEMAIKIFCAQCVTCSFTTDQGGRLIKCANGKLGHFLPFHRAANGLPIAFGGFDSTEIDEITELWLPAVELELKALESDLASNNGGSPPQSRLDRIWQHQLRTYQSLFQQLPQLPLNYIFTCPWCLKNAPSEVLPCGHPICYACIRALATINPDPDSDSRVLYIDRCVLHSSDHLFKPLHPVHLRPRLVGPRILSLDGGGVRGIIELQILDAIEKRMGSHIPIQRFFDLIAGTSAGGLIAFGMGIKDWKLDYLQSVLKDLCKETFSIPVSGWLGWLFRGSQYPDTPLVTYLKGVLGATADQQLVHARLETNDSLRPSPKVFATATIDHGEWAAILPNYIRTLDKDMSDLQAYHLSYEFGVSEEDFDRLSVWEALRATTAAPTYFPPFRKVTGGFTYYDGGLYHNNPSQIALDESLRIWPKSPGFHPDLILSIGCGCSATNRASRTSIPQSSGPFQSLEVLKTRLEQNLNSERAWAEGFGVLSRIEPGRYLRLNPQFNSILPKLDDTACLLSGQLERVAAEYLQSPETTAKIDQVARRLVATSFYIDPSAPVGTVQSGQRNFQGEIRCRFLNRSPELKAFADIIDKFCPLSQANFDLAPDLTIGRLTPEMVQTMRTSRTFGIPVSFPLHQQTTDVDITFRSPGFTAERISGCPFKLSDSGND